MVLLPEAKNMEYGKLLGAAKYREEGDLRCRKHREPVREKRNGYN